MATQPSSSTGLCWGVKWQWMDLKHIRWLQKTSFGVYITLSDWVPRLIESMITFMHAHTLYCKYNIADTIEFQMLQHGWKVAKSWWLNYQVPLVFDLVFVAVRGGGRVYSRWKTSFQCWLLGFYIQLNCNESMLNRKRFSLRFSTYQKRMKMTFNCVSNRPFRHFSVDECLFGKQVEITAWMEIVHTCEPWCHMCPSWFGHCVTVCLSAKSSKLLWISCILTHQWLHCQQILVIIIAGNQSTQLQLMTLIMGLSWIYVCQQYSLGSVQISVPKCIFHFIRCSGSFCLLRKLSLKNSF